jgi:hypothetical protein
MKNNKTMKTYTVTLESKTYTEYLVHAENEEQAKQDALDFSPNVIHQNTYSDTYEVYDVELLEEKETDYPFAEGDTYYTIDEVYGDWIESCWDCVSEEIHDANPNKEYYREPNKESKV